MKPTITSIAENNFRKWNDALQTKDPVKVAELYTDDATFLPTMSGDYKRGVAGAAEYFRHFLKKNPSGEIIAGEIDQINENCYLQSGLYNFTVEQDTAVSTMEARFTFLWKRDQSGDWKIAHHHSSLKPT